MQQQNEDMGRGNATVVKSEVWKLKEGRGGWVEEKWSGQGMSCGPHWAGSMQACRKVVRQKLDCC